jgi:peroxiredoxin Q/BCP
VVLFFYPIASSGGCTQEACHFRDLAAEFAAAGAQPVGISSDGETAQQEFASARLGYPLLSDAEHTVAKSLGAYRRWLPGGRLHTRRATYVIDTDRRLFGVVTSESKFDVHADEALAILTRHRAA